MDGTLLVNQDERRRILGLLGAPFLSPNPNRQLGSRKRLWQSMRRTWRSLRSLCSPCV